MVYIRKKKKTVHGIEYAYLVKSVWDKSKRIAIQRIIKYLSKSFDVTLDDIPLEYRNSVCDYPMQYYDIVLGAGLTVYPAKILW